MKKDIHPKYFKSKIRCACGHEFEVGGTLEKIQVEVCSKCHPFFTGKTHLIDTEGRVDKFKAKLEKAKAMKDKTGKKKSVKKTKEEEKKDLRTLAKDA